MTIQMPHDPAAERALLGALLINPDEIHNLKISVSDFHIERHRWIYEALRAVITRTGVADYIAVTAELRSMDKLREAGGDGYLLKLVADTPNSLHLHNYAEIVRQKARRRRVVEIAQRMVKEAMQDDSDLDSVIPEVLTALADQNESDARARHISEILKDFGDQVFNAYSNPRSVYGIQTGMTGFDNITAGLQRQEVFMLSGEPGIGKSLLAMQLVIGAAKEHNGVPGTPGVVYQLEMSDIAVIRRAVSAHSKIPTRLIRSGNMSEKDYQSVLAAITELEMLPIYICDASNITTLDIRADLARLKSHGVGWCLIDYMPLLKDNPNLSEVERTAILSDRLHAIAKDLDIHMMVISDMTKAGISGQIDGQAALAGNRRVGYNADQTAFLIRTKQENRFLLKWEKYRDEDKSGAALNLMRVPGFPVFAEVTEEKTGGKNV
ncbi:MAG: replicative DNA helicase [Chloroflexus sp.]|nr:MAG: replicative DNA helicase [Chloroflexus sp.]